MGITRGVDVDLLASLETSFNPVVLVYINWPDGAVRAHNSVGTITVFGEDWLGVSYYGIYQSQKNLVVFLIQLQH